jgi:hypothetical protein
MYAETVHQVWFQGGGRGKPLRPEAVFHTQVCGKRNAGGEQAFVKYLQLKIQGRKVVSYSHGSNLVGHSAEFDLVERKLERQDSL